MPASLRGVDAIVHCAVGGRAVTVDGTAALLRAAAEARVRRFVHLSSAAIYGDAQGIVTEQTVLVSPRGRGYAAWKSAAEQACLDKHGLEVVRLRPTIVYGPLSTLWLERMARRILSGRWGVLGKRGEGTCNLVHVSDVVTAVAAALTTPEASGAAFNINGPESLSWNDWFRRLADAVGAPPLRTISPAALRARSIVSLPVKAAARLRPGLASRWLLGAPAASELALFALSATYPIDAARTALAWKPQVLIAEGLADSRSVAEAAGTGRMTIEPPAVSVCDLHLRSAAAPAGDGRRAA